jgi:hypothetical protein
MPTKNGKAWVASANSAQQEGAKSDDIEKNADDNHGDGSRDKGCEGRAFHHHHGAVLGIADPVRVWNPLGSGWRASFQFDTGSSLLQSGDPLCRVDG